MAVALRIFVTPLLRVLLRLCGIDRGTDRSHYQLEEEVEPPDNDDHRQKRDADQQQKRDKDAGFEEKLPAEAMDCAFDSLQHFDR